MKRWWPAIAVVVVFFSVGYLLGKARVPARITQRPAAGRAAVSATVRPPPAPAVGPMSTRAPAPMAGDNLAELLEQRYPKGVVEPAGEGEITGRVLHQDGTPLEGVEVRARIPRERRRLSGTIVERIDAAARRALAQETRAAVATTAEDGTYVLRGLAEDALYSVSASQVDLYFKAVEEKLARKARAGLILDFVSRKVPAGPRITVPVEVTLGNGLAPLAQVKARETDGSSTRLSSWQPHKRDIFLQPGHYTMHAELGSFFRSDPVEVTCTGEPWTGDPLLLEMRPVNVLLLRIVEPPGSRKRRLAYRRLRVGEHPDDVKLRGWRQRMEGRGPQYRASDLEPGSYLIGDETERWVVDVGEGFTIVEVEAADRAEKYVLEVTVVDEQGEPLDEGVKFHSRMSDDKGGYGEIAHIDRAADGRYWVRPDKHLLAFLDGTKEGTGELQLRLEQRAHMRVPLEPGQRQVHVQLQPDASLEVIVPGYLGSGAEGQLSVRATRTTPDGTDRVGMYSGRADWLGDLRIHHLPPGEYDLELRYRGSLDNFTHNTEVWDSQRVVIGPGANVVRFALPFTYDVSVVFPDELHGQRIRLESEEPGRRSLAVPDDGVLHLEKLVGGEYRIIGGGGEMSFAVPGDDTVHFQPRVYDALRFKGFEKDTYADSGLEPGDLIVAISGTPVAEFYKSAEASDWRAQPTVIIEVLRSGERLEITVDPERLRAAAPSLEHTFVD